MKTNLEKGEEVLHLPTIVEAAESSPAAAKECAQVIRKFLSKDNYSRPHVQYNSIMLVRILSDNPGPTFTRNIDKKFADTVKELLRMGRDPSVKQILIETLDNFQREKKHDENLAVLIQMWEKEQAKMEKQYGPKVRTISYHSLRPATQLTVPRAPVLHHQYRVRLPSITIARTTSHAVTTQTGHYLPLTSSPLA
jgi:hypothetical protein